MKRIESKQTRDQKNRRGIAILWSILWGIVFLTFFCVVFEIATLWQAHVELNNGLDAAALAAVSEWDARRNLNDNSTLMPRQVGVDYAAANLVLGNPISLNTNYDAGDTPNENASCAGDFVFGNLTSAGSVYTFNANTTGNALAVRAQTTVPLNGFCSAVFGATIFNVSASSTAFFDSVNGRPELVRVTTFICN